MIPGAAYQCTVAFKEEGIDATLYIRAHKNKITLSFTDPKTKKESRSPCMTFSITDDYFTEDHDIYMFVAGSSGDDIPSQQSIHEIRFYDTNHLHDTEEVDSKADQKPFTGKHVDHLRKGQIQSNDQFTTDSYNRQLIKHNKIYSTVVSEFISNSETIVNHLHNLPSHAVMKNMTELADKINSRFSLMGDQFTKYDTDVGTYMKYLKEVTNKRLDMRYQNSADSSDFAVAQKDMMDKIGNMSKSLNQMGNVVSNNHLIE